MGNYPLSINYRCAKNILKTTSQLIEYNNPHRLEKKLSLIIRIQMEPPISILEMSFSNKWNGLLSIKEYKEKQSASYSSLLFSRDITQLSL